MMKKRLSFLCRAAVIAALYVVLTLVSDLIGLASGPIQVRLSEALCVLPFFTAAAVPGVTVGCFVSNLLFAGTSVFDLLFGTLATLIGAVGARLCRRFRYLVPLPTVVSNALILPFVLRAAGMAEAGIPLLMIGIAAGELIACGVLGQLLITVLKPHAARLFGKTESVTKFR